MIDIQWWRSDYDGQIHAFHEAQAGLDFGEAFCEHSVPAAMITCTHEGRRCMACLLLAGDLLADAHGDLTWRAS